MPTKEEISAVRAGMQSMNIHQNNDSVASLVSISDSCSSSSTVTTFDADLQQLDSLLDDVDIIEEQVVDAAPTLLCQRDAEDRRGEQLQQTCTNKCTIRKREDAPQRKFGINFLRPRQWNLKQARRRFIDSKDAEKVVSEASFSTQQKEEQPSEKQQQQQQQHPTTEKRPSILQNIVDDFTPNKGDQKILRAIGRTATVNAAVLLTAATGAAGAIGYATGGAITTKRLVDGIVAEDEKEITKSLAVYGCATGASIAGQALAGALMIGVAGASLPLAGVVAFGVGCVSGISAGAVSEWTVDSLHDIKVGGQQREKKKFMKKEEMEREVVKGSVEASLNDRDTISAGDTTISARRWTVKEADTIARLVCDFL